MIASRSSRPGTRLLLAIASAIGCTTPAAPPEPEFLLPMKRLRAFEPSPADHAAVDLAELTLLPAPEPEALARALLALKREIPATRIDGDLLHLAPLGQHCINATLADDIAYRKASDQLRGQDDVDQRLGQQLDSVVKDDPFRLAKKRTLDDRMTLFATTFNAISEPLGNSVLSGAAIAPYEIASSALNWTLTMLERDPLTVQGRQALAHRRSFLAQHPESPHLDELRRKNQAAQDKLNLTHHRSLMRVARAALDDSPQLAEELAERALHYEPQSEPALALRNEARARRGRVARLREASLHFSPNPVAGTLPDAARRLAEALFDPDADLTVEALKLREVVPDQYVDEVDYILATAQLENGYESASWGRLAQLQRRSGNMSRHAGALISSPSQNAYGAFVATKNRQRRQHVTWKILGNTANGPRYRAIPRHLSYLLQAPAMARSAMTSPVRLLFAPFEKPPDFHRPTSVAAYRYLGRHPDGEHALEVLDWVYDYEVGQKNWSAALRLADFRPGFSLDERDELSEKAALQFYQYAARQSQRDRRGSALRGVVREYPDSVAGDMAGATVRQELKFATAQRIRMTRGFLEENPWILGDEGLGLKEDLRDGENGNGELHPEGVTFLGGRVVEFAFLAQSGKEDEEPLRVQREVSQERLARVVGLLEETSRTNALVDRDDAMVPDPQRDLYFERARLGLTDNPDLRASAHSNYVYEGVRERYGIVRGRESILPFDLVFKGSFQNFTLGAFPRWRPPKKTPDSFLYR